MENSNQIPPFLKSVPLDGIQRIDVALEGDWGPTVVTVWSRDAGFIGFSNVVKAHPTYKPSVELYFKGVWLGIHCFTRTNDENVFDKHFARQIIDYVKSQLE